MHRAEGGMAFSSYITVAHTLLAMLVVPPATCCVFKYGESPDHAFAMPGSLRFSYEFAGLDWPGVCSNGSHQSPINIPSRPDFESVAAKDRTIMDFGAVQSNGSNVKIYNNGHVVQVEWADGAIVSNASVAVPDLTTGALIDTLSDGDKPHRAPITPLQFHFHAHSEHTIGGAMYPMELHIVSHAVSADLGGCTGPKGCLVVVGIMLAFSDDDADNQVLSDIFDGMGPTGKKPAFLSVGKTLDLAALLPSNKSYVTYSGSLTTPPCSENVLWHLMLEPLRISSKQLKDFLIATGDIECTEDPSKNSTKTATLNSTKVANGAEPNATLTCRQLGAGQNYRVIQGLNGRVIKSYVDAESARGSAGPISPSDSNNVPKSTSFAFTHANLNPLLLAALCIAGMLLCGFGMHQ